MPHICTRTSKVFIKHAILLDKKLFNFDQIPILFVSFEQKKYQHEIFCKFVFPRFPLHVRSHWKRQMRIYLLNFSWNKLLFTCKQFHLKQFSFICIFCVDFIIVYSISLSCEIQLKISKSTLDLWEFYPNCCWNK